MNAPRRILPRLLAGIGILVSVAGCISPPAKFAPGPYSVDPGIPHHLSTHRTVFVCPAFDRLSDEAREQISPSFNPSAFLTGAMEMELTAAGVAHDRVGFNHAPSFAGLQKALQDEALEHEGSVVLAGAINHYPNSHVLSCDFKLYSGRGDLLFEKRCLCIDGLGFGMVVPHMVMLQLFADPGFQRAIQ